MESALIVSSGNEATAFFTETLKSASIGQIIPLKTCGEARRLLLERDFDLVIVNAPLSDETGENFSRHVATQTTAQVILLVQNKYYEQISAVTGEYGVLTVAKPINMATFWAAFNFAKATGNRLRQMHRENNKLKQKIEDIRTVDRAKCILISFFGMNEQTAHRFIEKEAMDKRTTKRIIAEEILEKYENQS